MENLDYETSEGSDSAREDEPDISQTQAEFCQTPIGRIPLTIYVIHLLLS